MPAERNAASSSMTSASSSRWALADKTASRSAGEVATWGIEASPGGASRHGTAERPCLTAGAASAARLDDHQEDDDDDQRGQEYAATLDLLDRREDLGRRRAGWSAGRWRCRAQLDEVVQGVALDREGVGDRDEIQDDPRDEPRLVLGV